MTNNNEAAGLSLSRQDWIRYFVMGLVFLFPVVIATTDGGGSAIYTLLLLTGLAFGRKWSALQSWEKQLLWGFVAVFAVATLSLINTADLHEGGKALERFLRVAMAVPIYLLFRRYGFMFGPALAYGAIVGSLVMAVQGWYQVDIKGYALASGAYHKIIFGDLAVLWGAIAITYSLNCLNGWWRLSGFVAAGFAMYASLLSLTRGSWLFIPVFGLVLLWSYWHRLVRVRREVLIGGLVLLVAAVGLVWQSDRFQEGLERGVHDLETFAKDPATRSSWGTRINLWRNSFIILNEHPIIGSGLGDFQNDMKAMVEDGRSWSPYVAEYGHAHSIYIDALAKMGTLGFLAMVITMLLIPFRAFARGMSQTMDKTARFYAIGGVVALAAFATFGLTEGLWSRNPFVNSYVVCVVVFLAGLANHRYGKTG